MSTNNTMSAGERAARLAQMILEELVADKQRYPIGSDELNRQFKEACAQAGVDTKTVLVAVSHSMCDRVPGYHDKLEKRAKQLISMEAAARAGAQ